MSVLVRLDARTLLPPCCHHAVSMRRLCGHCEEHSAEPMRRSNPGLQGRTGLLRCARHDELGPPMRRADRLFQIIQILRRAGRPVTAEALAAELETSKRSVYRDIAALIGQRVP